MSAQPSRSSADPLQQWPGIEKLNSVQDLLDQNKLLIAQINEVSMELTMSISFVVPLSASSSSSSAAGFGFPSSFMPCFWLSKRGAEGQTSSFGFVHGPVLCVHDMLLLQEKGVQGWQKWWLVWALSHSGPLCLCGTKEKAAEHERRTSMLNTAVGKLLCNPSTCQATNAGEPARKPANKEVERPAMLELILLAF
eukprot:895993-Pelagomonas_calceolata.AAC.1